MKDCYGNDDNEYNDAPFYNGERISKIKTLLSQDLLKQERYIQIIKTSIINFNCGKKETSSKLCQMLQRFCELINYFDINIFFLFKFIIIFPKEKIWVMSSEKESLKFSQTFPILKRKNRNKPEKFFFFLKLK